MTKIERYEVIVEVANYLDKRGEINPASSVRTIIINENVNNFRALLFLKFHPDSSDADMVQYIINDLKMKERSRTTEFL